MNGTRVYSDSDLVTCWNGAGQGGCLSVAEIFFGSWFNPFTTDGGTGYTLLDNFIISKSYIGPPSSVVSSTPPTAPTSLLIQ